MNYPDSVQFLYSLGNEIKTFKPGLDAMVRLLDALGNPQDRFQVVHVAGTNGKGSTCAMIESGLRAAGVRTGLYTSPHLISPTERIQIAGDQIDEASFAAAFDRVHAAAERLLDQETLASHPSYFETVTAMAFLLFAERGVEIAVVEVGLGGRLDSTNVVKPRLCVITPIDFDHEAYLGASIEKIAAEKAGILKTGVPAILARQRPEAEAVLVAGSRSPIRTAEFPAAVLEVTARGSVFDLRTKSGTHRVRCPLPGEHQIENAVTAVVALEQLGVSRDAIEDGIARARWPGRLERVRESPDVILDGAHNPAGMRALAAYIERFFAGRRVWIIYGAMRDKAIDEVAGILFPLAARLIVTRPDTPRALQPEALREVWPAAELAPNLRAAIAIAGEADRDDVIFIAGSLYLVGEARALFIQ